jgi:hypothetical protein
MIHGKDIIISEGNPAVAIASAKSCQIVRQADTVEKSSPTSAQAREFEAGRTGWSVIITCFVLNVKAQLMRVGQTYVLTMGVRGSSTDKLTGTAICTECNITGTVGNLAQGSLRFLGSGELA